MQFSPQLVNWIIKNEIYGLVLTYGYIAASWENFKENQGGGGSNKIVYSAGVKFLGIYKNQEKTLMPAIFRVVVNYASKAETMVALRVSTETSLPF
jgi:hypothetical protein